MRTLIIIRYLNNGCLTFISVVENLLFGSLRQKVTLSGSSTPEYISIENVEHTLLYISKNLNRYLTLLLGLLKTIVIYWTLNRSKILRYNYRQVTILNQKKWYYITSRNSWNIPQHWILLKCYLETIYISIVTYLPSLISFYMCTGDFFPKVH